MTTVYPSQIDTVATLPSAIDDSTPVDAIVINRLRDAIIAVEAALGVLPQSTYGTVAFRLSLLQQEAYNSNAVSLQGNPVSPVFPLSGQSLVWSGSAWTPTTLPPAFVAGGDLSGAFDDQTVIGIQTIPVSSTTPVLDQVFQFNGSKWTPTTLPPAFTAGGDLSGTSTSQTLAKIHGYTLANTTPAQSDVIVYDTSSSGFDIRQLTLDDIGPAFAIDSFNISVSGGTTIEIGATASNPTFTMSYSSAPASATLTDSTSTGTVNFPSPYTSGSITGTFTETTQTDVYFTLTATAATTKTAFQYIYWYPRSFGGVGANGATSTVTASGNNAILSTGDTIDSLGLLSTDVGQTFGPFSPANQYIYLLLIGSSHTFKDANTGFAFPFNTPTAVSFTNQHGSVVAMYLYQSTNELDASYSIEVVS